MNKLEKALFFIAIVTGLVVIGMGLILLFFQLQLIGNQIASLFSREYRELIPIDFLLTLFAAIFVILLWAFLIAWFVYYVKEERKKQKRLNSSKVR